MLRKAMVSLLAASIFSAFQTVQTTSPGALGIDREQRMLVSEQQMQAAAAQAYREQLTAAQSKGVLNRNSTLTNRVRRIASDLQRASSAFRPDAPSWNWEVNTLAVDEVNAYAMPGGKIMVYEGIVEKLKLTDDEIAAIMGHEIAHALREHSRERVSRQYAQQLAIGGAAAIAGVDSGIAGLADQLATVTFQLPFSRDQESEADAIGLELMARAGYDPNAAVTLWQKMIAQEKQSPPEFLSTHPSPGARIQHLQSLVPRVQGLNRTARK